MSGRGGSKKYTSGGDEIAGWHRDARPRILAVALVASLALASIPSIGANAAELPPANDSVPTAGTDGDGSGTESQQEAGSPAAAADLPDPDPSLPDLALDVRVKSDGTPTWDADDSAGNDSGPNNDIVRVNDTVTYEVEYAVPAGAADNVTFAITFPRGVEIRELPGFCLEAGSSIAPATAGEPGIPLSATSRDELSEQTLVCNRGTIVSGTDIVDVTVKVLNYVHQGQSLPIESASVIADGYNGAVAPDLPSVTASARLMWDISKNGVALEENTGYAYGPGTHACAWDSALTCKLTIYSVLLSAPAGGKGAMPAIGDITFVDDFSPAAMYPSLSSADIAAIEADLDKYGSRAVPYFLEYGQPAQKIGESPAWTEVNSVRDSGTMTIVQPGPGTPAQITISGADTSLRSYPTQMLNPTGTALPGDSAYAISLRIGVYTPVATIRDFGIESPQQTSWVLPTYNGFTDLDIRGFDPVSDVETSADQPGSDAIGLPTGVDGPVHWNDYRLTYPIVELTGSFRKFFMGVPGAPGNMSAIDFEPSFSVFGEGPAGGATRLSGGITVAGTQVVTSQLLFLGTRADAPAPVSAIGCDAWDNTKLHLTAKDVPAAAGTNWTSAMQRVPSEGAAVWVSGYNNVPGVVFATRSDQVPDVTFQYSASTGADGVTTECGDSSGPWYDSPDLVPGNDAALAADGVFTGVARIRAFVNLPEPFSNDEFLGNGVMLAVSIALTAADNGAPTGTILPNYGGVKMVVGEDLTPEELLAHPAPWSASTYDSSTHSGPGGDRLILAQAQVRVDKQVRKGDSGSFSSTPPATTGGDLVQYRLQPSLTSGAMTPDVLKDVWVEDCLPASQIYTSATIVPVLSQQTTPADAKRPACAAGETYLRWVFEDHEVNTAMPPIIMSVAVDPAAEDGVYENTVVVWAQDDASTLEQRSDEAQIQISNIRGVRITKQPLTPVVQVNRSEQSVFELNEWSIRFSNRLPGNAPVPTDVDIIDVLPKLGSLGSDFSGSFTFHSAQITEGNAPGQAVRILYTSAANPSDIATAPSNGATGSTAWCDAAAAGSVVSGAAGSCPASTADVTAIRVQRPGPFSTGAAIQFTIRMVGIDNRGGDVYVNQATGHATGLESVVRSLPSPEVAIESSVGDYTWWDFNRNGLQDLWKGSPEQPASGVRVQIAGVDDLGNAVALSAVTGATGEYLFDRLRSSNGDGYTVTFTEPDGAEFTAKEVGDDRTADSNADPITGAAEPVVLGRDATDRTIDAGFLPLGDVRVNKLVTGAGSQFATGDELEFQVVCTFDDGLGGTPTQLLDETVTFVVTGGQALTSDPLGPLPAFAECLVTERASGSADATPAPVSVVIPWDATAQVSGTVTASLTNSYSAGTVDVRKELAGDSEAVKRAESLTFEIQVTCQIEEPTESDGVVRVTLHSGAVTVRGGETKPILGTGGQPMLLPLGAVCFGVETANGGADESRVNFTSFENGVAVTAGDPDNLQRLTITAVNTFKNPPGALGYTGSELGWGVFAGGGLSILGLLLLGLVAMLRLRNRFAE